MWRPGSHSQAYHPPEAGRVNGPNTRMGEVRPPMCKKWALQLRRESARPGVGRTRELGLAKRAELASSRWALGGGQENHVLGHMEDPGLLAFVFVPHVECCSLIDGREMGGECARLTPSSLSSWETGEAKRGRWPGRGP